jgi:protein-tyrosine phosphatase
METRCEMIDLHCHILSGLDDGPGTVEESLAMARMGYGDGTRVVVATPHTLNGLHYNGRSAILAKVKEFKQALNQCGFRNSDCGFESKGSSDSERRTPNSEPGTPDSERRTSNSEPVTIDSEHRTPNSELGSLDSELRTPNAEVRILPGSDVRLCEKTLQELDEGNVLTVGDEGKYLMLEFPTASVPPQSENLLAQLLKRGIVPIITHPERNMEIVRKPERYYEMIRMGCLGQVTAMSLTGGFGTEAKRVAEKLLTHRLLHIIASDAHSSNGRPPVLSKAVEAAAKLIGESEARKMVVDCPQAIVEGLSIRFAS